MILAPETLQAMKASRKADRNHIAHELRSIAAKHGAAIEERQEARHPGYCGAGIYLRFTVGGVGAMVTINDLHGGDYALIHWFNDGNERGKVRDFGPRFNQNVGAGCSGRPHHKATTCPNGWYPLAKALDAGLYLAARDEAFLPLANA